ncbi:hypothetical protein GJAV_G00068360 [Gymnothorax javanicus]|nr:hypothetical protein GJAV_G00068360 [Gymnothorax javanicus]
MGPMKKIIGSNGREATAGIPACVVECNCDCAASTWRYKHDGTGSGEILGVVGEREITCDTSFGEKTVCRSALE